MKLEWKSKYVAVVGVAAFGVLAAAQPATAQQIWSAGHGDIGLEYDPGDDPNAFEPTWHLGEDDETVILDGIPQNFGDEGMEFEPDAIIAFSDRVDPRPAGALWDPTGVSEGEPLYIFPFTEDPTVPFLGLGLEELDAIDWLSDITIELTSVSGGPGDFSVYLEDAFGDPTFLMTTSDGISGDVIIQTAGTHEHYNWVFSEKGTYDVTFSFTGEHVVNGNVTGSGTYTFTVTPEPSRALFLLAGLCGVVLQRRRKS